MRPLCARRSLVPRRDRLAGRSIFYPILHGTSRADVVALTRRMFCDDEMVLGKWMASLGRILL